MKVWREEQRRMGEKEELKSAETGVGSGLGSW